MTNSGIPDNNEYMTSRPQAIASVKEREYLPFFRMGKQYNNEYYNQPSITKQLLHLGIVGQGERRLSRSYSLQREDVENER